MGLQRLFNNLAPAVGLIAMAALSGCGDNMNVEIDGDGVPLAELDMTGDPPTGVVLAGSDKLIITVGEEFEIEVTGTDEARARMRFARDGETLAVHRSGNQWGDSDIATVEITLPQVDNIVIAGSGEVTASGLASEASVVISGSGSLETPEVASASLDVVIAGSGRYTASGTAERLSLNIAGSGAANLRGLSAERADVNTAGSGEAVFSSNGRVDANIIGSGTVRVVGSARCEVNTVGSGRLVCEDADS